jgi:hypothetical protein
MRVARCGLLGVSKVPLAHTAVASGLHMCGRLCLSIATHSLQALPLPLLPPLRHAAHTLMPVRVQHLHCHVQSSWHVPHMRIAVS